MDDMAHRREIKSSELNFVLPQARSTECSSKNIRKNFITLEITKAVYKFLSELRATFGTMIGSTIPV